jgi:GTP cyclohydrolase I
MISPDKFPPEVDFSPIFTQLVEALKVHYKDWPEGVIQFTDTERRLKEMYNERCWPISKIQAELDKTVRVFSKSYDELVVVGPAVVYIWCPHHLLPCEIKVVQGVLPGDKVLGISKFTRIAELLGRKPVLQEDYTTELVEFLMTKLNPKGAGVHVTGCHSCTTSRGVKQPSTNKVVTNAVRGVLLTDKSLKDEFFKMVEMRTNDR